jgi:hypothetical protein
MLGRTLLPLETLTRCRARVEELLVLFESYPLLIIAMAKEKLRLPQGSNGEIIQGLRAHKRKLIAFTMQYVK